ncbi:MAG: DUF1848 domain-containing protein [Dehalococcoidia bacterium]
MIISASRRTDIPAFYSQWFINRIREGYCLVPNPYNTKMVSRISLQASNVDVIVFWSKNPAPLLPYLSELDQRGLRYYFQFSLNDYPLALEPNLPPINDRIATFKELSRLIGASRIVWRYDPIIISNATPFEFHKERFSLIAEELRESTHRVMVSIVDFYKKTDRRLTLLENEEGYTFHKDISSSVETLNLLKDLSSISRMNNIDIFSCAEERDYSLQGVPPGKCIDEKVLKHNWLMGLIYKKDPYQRASCLCMVSKDIGVNDTCMHGCPYCYATTSYSIAQLRYNEHDPYSPLLWGKLDNSIVNKEKADLQPKLV